MAANIISTNDPALVALIKKVEGGQVVTLTDLLGLTQSVVPVPEAPIVKVATPREITDSQRAAIRILPSVFATVVPGEPRVLEPVEVEALIVEKETLDEVSKMARARLDDIVATVHNHLDSEYADQITEDLTERAIKVAAAGGDENSVPPVKHAPRDKNGHYIVAGRVGVEGKSKVFTRETRTGAPSLNVALLQALDTGEPDAIISHEDYLSMTTQTRVFDEAKAMLAVRKNPALVRAIAAATEPGVDGTSIYLRNGK